MAHFGWMRHLEAQRVRGSSQALPKGYILLHLQVVKKNEEKRLLPQVSNVFYHILHVRIAVNDINE